MSISFDFDGTLCFEEDGSPNQAMLDIVRFYSLFGYECHIVTNRNSDHEQFLSGNRVAVKDFIEKHQLPIAKIHYTNHTSKKPVLEKIGAKIHYDDKQEHILSAKELGIVGIKV